MCTWLPFPWLFLTGFARQWCTAKSQTSLVYVHHLSPIWKLFALTLSTSLIVGAVSGCGLCLPPLPAGAGSAWRVLITARAVLLVFAFQWWRRSVRVVLLFCAVSQVNDILRMWNHLTIDNVVTDPHHNWLALINQDVKLTPHREPPAVLDVVFTVEGYGVSEQGTESRVTLPQTHHPVTWGFSHQRPVTAMSTT